MYVRHDAKSRSRHKIDEPWGESAVPWTDGRNGRNFRLQLPRFPTCSRKHGSTKWMNLLLSTRIIQLLKPTARRNLSIDRNTTEFTAQKRNSAQKRTALQVLYRTSRPPTVGTVHCIYECVCSTVQYRMRTSKSAVESHSVGPLVPRV